MKKTIAKQDFCYDMSAAWMFKNWHDKVDTNEHWNCDAVEALYDHLNDTVEVEYEFNVEEVFRTWACYQTLHDFRYDYEEGAIEQFSTKGTSTMIVAEDGSFCFKKTPELQKYRKW